MGFNSGFKGLTSAARLESLAVRLFLMCTYGRWAGIAARSGLDGPGIESRWWARFSTPVQTGPGAHQAYYTMGTWSFPEVKRPGRGVDHPPHLVPRLRKSRAIPLLPLWAFVACSRLNFTFTFLSTGVVVTDECNIVIESGELFGTTEYVTL